MNRRLIVRPEAESDITETAVWYDNHELGLGLKFVSEVQSAIARAIDHPESFIAFDIIPRFVVFLPDNFPIESSSLFIPTQ